MKLVTLILSIVLTLNITSCGSSDDSSSNTSNNSFFAKIDGVDYNPEFVNGFIVIQDNLSISGSDSNGDNLVLNFPLSAASGDTFTVNNQFVASFDSSSGNGVLSSSGSITITTHNTETKRISGTFNFVGLPIETTGTSYIFTEGSFEVTYTKIL